MKKKQVIPNKIPRNIIKTGGFKFLDTTLGSDIPSTTSGSIVIPSINIVPTGTNAKTRVGKKIRVFKVEYRIQITRGAQTNNQVTSTSSKTCFVLDNATRGSSPVFNDIFETASINTFVNSNSTNRFTILKSISTVINTLDIYNTGSSQFDIMAKTTVNEGSISVNIPILFSATGSAGTVVETVANCILLTFIGDNTSSTLVNAGTAFRIYFIDES